MTKYIFLFLSLFSLAPAAQGCDICGCGVGSYYLGILPEFNKRFGGLRYQHKTMRSHLGPTGERTPLTNDEAYQTLELWGGWNIGKRFRVLGIVPYNFIGREIKGSGMGAEKTGLGDIALMGYYSLFQSAGTVGNKLLVQSLWVGAGVKLPTGLYDPGERSDLTQEESNNFQLGTGSTDVMLNAAYDLRLQDMGINLNLNYKLNTENRHEYRYGNKFTANMLAYYKFNIQGKVRIAPNAGVLFETAEKDLECDQYRVAQSGGYSYTAIAGVEFNVNKVSFGANYQAPFSQNLAEKRVDAGNRWMTHVSFSF